MARNASEANVSTSYTISSSSENASVVSNILEDTAVDGSSSEIFSNLTERLESLRPATTSREGQICGQPPPLYEDTGTPGKSSGCSLPPSYASNISFQSTAELDEAVSQHQAPHPVYPVGRRSNGASGTSRKSDLPVPSVHVPRQQTCSVLEMCVCAGSTLLINVPFGICSLLLLICSELDVKRGQRLLARGKRSLALLLCRAALAINAGVVLYLAAFHWFSGGAPRFASWLAYVVFGGHAYVFNDSEYLRLLLRGTRTPGHISQLENVTQAMVFSNKTR